MNIRCIKMKEGLDILIWDYSTMGTTTLKYSCHVKVGCLDLLVEDMLKKIWHKKF